MWHEYTHIVILNLSQYMSAGSLKKLGDEILDRKYESNLSNYVYEKPGEITASEADVDSELENLTILSASKRTQLDADLKRELEKEELRLEFSNKANDFAQYVDDTCLIINPFAGIVKRRYQICCVLWHNYTHIVTLKYRNTFCRSWTVSGRSSTSPGKNAGKDAAIDPAQAPYGATLAEVVESGKRIVVEDAEIMKNAEANQSSYKDTMQKMAQLNVTENQYTKYTAEELDDARIHLEGVRYAIQLIIPMFSRPASYVR